MRIFHFVLCAFLSFSVSDCQNPPKSQDNLSIWKDPLNSDLEIATQTKTLTSEKEMMIINTEQYVEESQTIEKITNSKVETTSVKLKQRPARPVITTAKVPKALKKPPPPPPKKKPKPVYKATVAQLYPEFVLNGREREFGSFPSSKRHSIDHILRQLIFQKNMEYIISQNSRQDLTFKLGQNQLMRFSLEELKQLYLNLKVPSDVQKTKVIALNKKKKFPEDYPQQIVPKSLNIDWAQTGVITNVKNQGSCGSGYAFAAVSSIQSSMLMAGLIENNLAEQQVIDCSKAFGNLGCSGGWIGNVFQYAIHHGITWQETYPFVGVVQYCKLSSATYQIQSYNASVYDDCSAMANMLKDRPIAIAISAGNPNFIYYSSGILNDCGQQAKVDHAVLLVGAYQSESVNYWKIKNSFGTDWGQEGYMRIDRNANGGNTCSVCSYPQYPISPKISTRIH